MAQRIVDFYTRVLDFRERSRDRIPSTPLGPLDLVYLELGGTTVEVMNFPEPHSRSPTWTRRSRTCEIRDPDGNAIELRHWIRAPSL